MMEQAKEKGLNVELHNVKVGMPNTDVTGSLGGVWWLLEALPIQRRSYCTDGTSKMQRCEEFGIPFEACEMIMLASRTPHLGKGRKVLSSQYIHWTVRASLKDLSSPDYNSYIPKASLKLDGDTPLTWELMIHPPSEDVALNTPAPKRPSWEGGKNLINAVDLAKQGLSMNTGSTWLDNLFNYVTTSGTSAFAFV
jgi:hypothetical protein